MKEILPYYDLQDHFRKQLAVPCDKEYKDTLLISSNESTADFEEYGQYHENGKKARQRRVSTAPKISIIRNRRSWYDRFYNSICLFSDYIWTEIKMSEEIKSHLFAIRTTGGQEKVVLRLLEAKANANQINIQSVLLVDNLKGYVVIEAINPSDAYMAVEGVRHIRGQLRGELEFKDIEGYLIKKSTVSQLAVDNVIEITGGPFKGMKATITRIDVEKEEATVVLLDASYQLPVTVDANYLKLVTGA